MVAAVRHHNLVSLQVLVKTISPDSGHFTQTPLGMSFFFAVEVGYWGLLK